MFLLCYVTNYILLGTSGGEKATEMSLVELNYSGAGYVPIHDGLHAHISGRTSFLCAQSLPCQPQFFRHHLLQPCRYTIQRIQQGSSSESLYNYSIKTRDSAV